MTTPLATLSMILAIGLFASFAFTQYARRWPHVGMMSHKTSALIGIAGAFLGFHIGVVLGLMPSPLMLYLAALVGAFLVMWGWRRWL